MDWVYKEGSNSHGLHSVALNHSPLRVSSPCEYSFNPTVNADNDPARAVDVRFDPVFLALVLRLSRNGRTTTFSRFGEFGERRPSAFEVRIRRSCSGLSCCHSWPSEIGRDNPRWVKELGAGDIMFQEARVIKDVWKIDQLPCEIILAIRSADSKGVPCC